MFKEKCFGHFLDESDMVLSGQFCHHILLRECHVKNDEENSSCLWYHVGIRMIRFSPVEFCLIIRLAFGEYSKTTSNIFNRKNSRLRRSYFQESKVNVKMVVDWFRNLIPNNNNSDEDMVKLALILFLEMTLVGKDDRNAILYLALELVDNLDAFNKFRWESFIYARTFNSPSSCLVGRDDKFKDKFKEGRRGLMLQRNVKWRAYHIQSSWAPLMMNQRNRIGQSEKKELITLEKVQKRLDDMQAQQNALKDHMTSMKNSLMDEMRMGFLLLTELICLNKVAEKLNEHTITNLSENDNIRDYQPSVPRGVMSPKFVVVSETSQDVK
ncbi:hypothetical protein Ddye_005766 [Dipteronia dyeriana]|uniref:DUF1985 domain-containing protein n=1 Tax=Dipteronia dyeriana TaxID=168575 RepID=A0AAE0CQJ8_9ROSI|nr:hypothetical protein Ddye_005766 [Dipteronia dyeriana]